MCTDDRKGIDISKFRVIFEVVYSYEVLNNQSFTIRLSNISFSAFNLILDITAMLQCSNSSTIVRIDIDTYGFEGFFL